MKRAYMATVLFLFFLFAGTMRVSASSQVDDKISIGIILGADAEGNLLSAATGIAVKADAESFVFSGAEVYSENVKMYLYFPTYEAFVAGDGQPYAAVPIKVLGDNDAILWDLSGAQDEHFAMPALGQSGLELSVCYLDADLNFQSESGATLIYVA